MRIDPKNDKLRIGIDLPRDSIDVPYLQNPQVKGWFEKNLDEGTWQLKNLGDGMIRFELLNMTADMIELTLDAMKKELWATPNDSRNYIVGRLRQELNRAKNSRNGQSFLCV